MSPIQYQSAATPEMRSNVIYKEDTPIIMDYLTAHGPDGIKFDAWFGNSYLPSLAHGFSKQALTCYAVPSRASYLSILELGHDLPSSIHHPPLSELPASVAKHERFLGLPLGKTQRRDGVTDADISNAIAYPAFLSVPLEKIDEIGRWYEEEHLPILMGCDHWLMARRFRITSAVGNTCTHVAIHYLKSLKTLTSPDRDRARETPWRDALIAEGWFSPEYRVSYPMKVVPF